MTDKKIYEQTKPRYSRDINITTDNATLNHTQHSATEDSYERFQNLIAELQNLDGIHPDNTPIGVSGGIALTWSTDEYGTHFVGVERLY